MFKTSKQLKDLYQSEFFKYGVNQRSLMWYRKNAGNIRYRQFIREVDFNGKNILEVGSGFGDFIPLLEKHYKGFNYCGVDMVPEFIQESQKLYPNHRFIERDYFNNPLKEKFDVIVCSGALNANMAENMTFRRESVITMFNYSKICLIFNMLGGHPHPKNFQSNLVWYADSIEIVEFCMVLSRKVVLRQDYLVNDFTICLYK